MPSCDIRLPFWRASCEAGLAGGARGLLLNLWWFHPPRPFKFDSRAPNHFKYTRVDRCMIANHMVSRAACAFNGHIASQHAIARAKGWWASARVPDTGRTRVDSRLTCIGHTTGYRQSQASVRLNGSGAFTLLCANESVAVGRKIS